MHHRVEMVRSRVIHRIGEIDIGDVLFQLGQIGLFLSLGSFLGGFLCRLLGSLLLSLFHRLGQLSGFGGHFLSNGFRRGFGDGFGGCFRDSLRGCFRNRLGGCLRSRFGCRLSDGLSGCLGNRLGGSHSLYVRSGLHRLGGLPLQSNRRKNQGVDSTKHHNTGQCAEDVLPYSPSPDSCQVFTQQFIEFLPHENPLLKRSNPWILLSSLFSFSQFNRPNSSMGQTTNTIFPTISSSEMQPTVLLRESTEVARLSPITKILPSGT